MSSTFTTSSNASMPVSSALSRITASEGRNVEMFTPIRVIGSSPNSRFLAVVSGKCSASKICIRPGFVGGDQVDDQIAEDETLDFVHAARFGLQKLLEPVRRKVRVGQCPRERAAHRDAPAVAVGLGEMNVIDRSDLEPARRETQRRSQVSGQVERLGPRHHLIEGLQVLECLVRFARRFLLPPLDVFAEDGLWPQQRRQRPQIIGHLHSDDVGDGARQLSEHQERLNAVASVHREGSVSGLPP